MNPKFLIAFLLAIPVANAGETKQASASDDSCAEDAGWNDPSPPRHIHGNTWYVGTCGISALLITSPDGHVLVDGGTEKAAPLIEANIRAAGFNLRDVRYIVTSHEHHDHVGGIAQLQRDTGATVVAREPAASTLELGRSDRNDPQFQSLTPFPPVTSVRRISDGETLALGPISLKALATPGHAPGGTSWTWLSCESGRCVDIAYVDSLTAISDDDYRFADEATHPGVIATFRRTLESVAALPCDVLVTPHPSASKLWSRIGPKPTLALIDPQACKVYAAAASTRLDQRIEQENKGSTP